MTIQAEPKTEGWLDALLDSLMVGVQAAAQNLADKAREIREAKNRVNTQAAGDLAAVEGNALPPAEQP